MNLRVEAAPGCSVPAECFVALQLDSDEATDSTPPCNFSVSGTKTFNGLPIGKDVAVDVFLRIGRFKTHIEPGYRELSVPWPGLGDLILNLVLEWPAAGQDLELKRTEDEVGTSPHLAKTNPEDILRELEAESSATLKTKERAKGRTRDLEFGRECSPDSEDRSLDFSRAEDEAPPAERPLLVEEREVAAYKPISLTNCDLIIPCLYLGGIDAAVDTARLVDQGIRAVVCCCREVEFPSKDENANLEYYRVDVEDMSREPIELFFEEATEFISQFISREQPVLVHCRAGVSRSASIILAYLIRYHNYNLHDAFFLTRSHRRQISPNIGFIEKLIEWEEKTTGNDASIDEAKYTGWYTADDRAAVPDLSPD